MKDFNMPGDAEAQGAIAGMQETYGTPQQTPYRKGDRVTFYVQEKPVRATVTRNEDARGLVVLRYDYAGGSKELALFSDSVYHF